MDERTAARIAADVATALMGGEFDRVTQRFDAAMREGLPHDRLAEVWGDFIAEHGAATARGSIDVAQRGQHHVAVVRVAFERAPADLRLTIGSSGKIEGLYLVPSETPAEQVRAASRLRIALIASIPLMAAVVAGYVLLARILDEQIRIGPVLVGIGGWALALSLRAPVALLSRRAAEPQARTLIVASSGPLEEGVRLGALAIAGSTFAEAYSLGLGWASIEIVYAVINGFVAFTLAGREDETSAEVRKQLARQGALRPGTTLWGVVERIFATAFHIGATLLIAAQPWLVLLMIPVHSGLNLVAVHMARGAAWKVQGVIALVGAVTLGSALLIAPAALR